MCQHPEASNACVNLQCLMQVEILRGHGCFAGILASAHPRQTCLAAIKVSAALIATVCRAIEAHRSVNLVSPVTVLYCNVQA